MENIKRIVRLIVAALVALVTPVCALAEEAATELSFVGKFFETGKITVLGMCGIFVVMIIIYLVITVLNKVTK